VIAKASCRVSPCYIDERRKTGLVTRRRAGRKSEPGPRNLKCGVDPRFGVRRAWHGQSLLDFYAPVELLGQICRKLCLCASSGRKRHIARNPPNLGCNFPPGASTNDIAGQILASKKTLENIMFSMALSGCGDPQPPIPTFVDRARLKRAIPCTHCGPSTSRIGPGDEKVNSGCASVGAVGCR
jgi:hypothetical protein